MMYQEMTDISTKTTSAACTTGDALLKSDMTVNSSAGSATVTIEGDTVRCDPACGAFITMNPGYLGRSELPEGLKALFRPITVMVPDLVLICENMLMAEGYVDAKVLASKFYGLYSLLKDLPVSYTHLRAHET